MTLHVEMIDHAWVWFDYDHGVWMMDCPDCGIRYELLVHVDHLQAVAVANLHNARNHGGKP